jgi:hypothetical protein
MCSGDSVSPRIIVLSKETIMPIWKLKVIDANMNNDVWKRSTYRGEVHVRAASEAKACEIVRARLSTWGTRVFPEKTPVCPWEDPAMVSVSVMENAGYSVSGNEDIVGPPEVLPYVD